MTVPRSRIARFLGTLAGRAIVVGVAVRLLVFLADRATGTAPVFLDIVDTVAGVAIAAGIIYFLVNALVLAKRRLLWRVRRKLILSYFFMGFVPVILIGVFFALCGLLLFFNFSSYLVQSRLQALKDRARFTAASAALEIQRAGGAGSNAVAGILGQRQREAAGEYPGISAVLVPADAPCKGGAASAIRASDVKPVSAGPWAHGAAPRTAPAWIECAGFGGLQANNTELVVRAVAFPDAPAPGYAVIVDVPVGDQVKQQLRKDTGVQVKDVTAINTGDKSDPNPNPLPARAGVTGGASGVGTGPLSWVTFLEYRDWKSGQPGTLLVSTQLSISEIYSRMSAAQGVIGNRSFGSALLLVLLVVVGGLFLVIEGVALVVGFALAKSITGSVHELFTGTERVRQGDFTHKIAVTAKDQLGELAESFNSMTDSIEGLLVEAAEKKRMEEELRIAHEIQMSLLPQGPLVMTGLSVSALCVPAREVGGDYYDFLRLDDHRVGVLIADVSGKGTSAALYMAELKGLVLSLSEIHTSPRTLLLAANRIIASHLDARSFITMTYAVFDLRARTMTYARAGHTPLIYVPGAGVMPRGARVLAPDGMVVGLKIDNGERFEGLLEEQTIPLTAGDLYVFFTDGISEAMNAADDCFGETRLAQLAEHHAHLGSDELRERVLRDIESFVDGAPQHDDMTMILLKVDELSL